jgi:hypothetical protein
MAWTVAAIGVAYGNPRRSANYLRLQLLAKQLVD